MKDAPATVPWILGLAGLIPFWALALCLVTGRGFGFEHTALSFALAAYAATIASFLGGMRWGLAMREPQRDQAWSDYLLAVLPQLLGWGFLILPDPQRLWALAVLIIVTGPMDLGLVRRQAAPVWFGSLRMVLSFTAGAGLLAAAAA